MAEAVAVGLVTAFWILIDLWLLLNPDIADGLAGNLGTSAIVLEFGVLFLGGLATWTTHWAAENLD